MRSIALAIVLILAGAAQAQGPACNIDAVSVSEYQRYDADGATWATIVVQSKVGRDCVIELARSFHQREPTVRFEFFDARGKELAQYVRWASNGMSDRDPYPEGWLRKHRLASLVVVTEGRGTCRWLLDFENGDDVKFDSYPSPCILEGRQEGRELSGLTQNRYYPMKTLCTHSSAG